MTPVKDHILYHLIEFYLLKGMISVRLVSHSHGYMFPYSFLQTAEPDYRRLTLSQPVGLRHTGYVITVNNVIKVRGERRMERMMVIMSLSNRVMMVKLLKLMLTALKLVKLINLKHLSTGYHHH